MKIKNSLLVICSIIISWSFLAQELYIPRNIQQAYENGTRSKNGKPGKNYWQNHASYTIQLKVNPPDRTIVGKEKIIYTNNSPDTLKKLNFKLIINSHKPNAPRGRFVPEGFLTPGLKIDSYKENGEVKEWNDKNDATNKFMVLSAPLLPGESVEIDIDWHYQLSEKSGREGVIKNHSYFIAYFFPRIAVYDDYYGWDRTPHLLSQEFYNDFSDFTVHVTSPANYIVWATGKLQNPKEVLKPYYYKLWKKSLTSDSIIHIVTPKDLEIGKITQQKEWVTWTWKATHIPDFTLAISNEYCWDAGSVVVDDKTNRRVSVQAAYDSVSTDFEKMVDYCKNAIRWFSTNVPGIPYPYPKLTAFRGFANMEYPMLINDSSQPDRPLFTRFVAEHEIAHMYFPFYMGFNETRFGYMDEGWATTLEHLIGIDQLGKEKAEAFFKLFRVKRWANDPTMPADIPIITPTNLLRGRAMGNNEYGKSALCYLAMRDLLGEDKFKNTLKKFMERWNGKHPNPWDFFFSFNNIAGDNYNWFWNAWFFERNHIDLKVKSVKTSRKEIKITIENKGGIPVPFDIELTMKDGAKRSIHKTPSVWENNSEPTLVIENSENKKVQKITIQNGIWMDVNSLDNQWEK